MSAPAWARWVLGRVAPANRVEDLVGDLEEGHGRRSVRHGRMIAGLLTGLEALDLALALKWEQWRSRRFRIQSSGFDGSLGHRGRGGPLLSWLDFKLGMRMLAKYPGLTAIGVASMAVAIAMGAILGATRDAFFSTLPFEDGDRVVAIENFDTEVNNQEFRSLHDFLFWREELESIEDFGAWSSVGRNLAIDEGGGVPISVVRMTASGFDLARVPALLGRTLIATDEEAGAADVVVIGHDVWRTRFDADPGVVGREVRIGHVVHTIVGVMPEGFAFPMNDRFWVPFRANPLDWERRDGPSIRMFGRLADGITLETAQAELTTLALRAAAAHPQSNERLRPRVVPYTLQLYDDMEGWEFTGLHVIVVLLLLIVCANVAILVYARTVTRRGEIALRTALGARRTRVVCQLFMEAFVLSAAASVLGLVIAAIALRQADAVIEPLPFAPFWIEFGLSARTVSFVSLLALTGALIVGVVPGLKATGRRMPVSLQRIAAGVSAMSLGRTWTALVVTQVAFTVMALPPSVQFTALLLRSGFADAGFAAENVLSARLLVDREIPPSAERETSEIEFTRRYASLQSELIRRVEAEPGISAVTWSVQLPGGEPSLRVEVESTEATTRPESASRAHYSQVASGLLDTFGVPVTAGRSFTAADIGAANGALIVNGAFVRELLGGSNAIGRRIRFTEGYRSNRVMRYPAGVEPDRWYEIIGVVGEFPVSSGSGVVEPAVFAPMAPGQTWPVRIHIGSRDASPSVLTARVREIASDIDGDLRLVDLGPLDEAMGQARTGFRLGALGIGLVMLCVVVLAAAGLHALMSFTVSQRQREIGIRLALGAAPRALLGSIFARALRQLAIGVAAGVTVFTLIDFGMNGQIVTAESAVLVAAVAVFMVVIGLLAAAGPARRGLRIQPTEALREER